MTFQTVFRQRSVQQIAIIVAAIVLVLWTVFPFVWILLTSLKSPVDIISVPPKFLFTPTTDNYMALVMGEQHGQYASTRPDFPRFFLNSMIISFGAVAVSVAAGIPAAYALARFDFPLKNALAFVFMSFRFVPFIAFGLTLVSLTIDDFGNHSNPADALLQTPSSDPTHPQRGFLAGLSVGQPNSPTPEPGTIVMLLGGLGAMVLLRKRRVN